jgi:hypothetical protein
MPSLILLRFLRCLVAFIDLAEVVSGATVLLAWKDPHEFDAG